MNQKSWFPSFELPLWSEARAFQDIFRRHATADALRVRRMVLDLIAGEPGEQGEDSGVECWDVRGLIIVRKHDPEDEFPQRLTVFFDDGVVFSIWWTADDDAQRADCLVPGEWQKRLLP